MCSILPAKAYIAVSKRCAKIRSTTGVLTDAVGNAGTVALLGDLRQAAEVFAGEQTRVGEVASVLSLVPPREWCRVSTLFTNHPRQEMGVVPVPWQKHSRHVDVVDLRLVGPHELFVAARCHLGEALSRLVHPFHFDVSNYIHQRQRRQSRDDTTKPSVRKVAALKLRG